MTFSPRLKFALNILAMAFSVLLCVGMLISGYGGIIDPRITTIGALATMIFPYIFYFACVWIVILVICRCRPVIMVIITTIVCLPALLTHSPTPFNVDGIYYSAPTPPRDSIFTFVTYNAHSFRTLSDTKGLHQKEPNDTYSVLLDTDPSIICMQEGIMTGALSYEQYSMAQLDSIFDRYPYRRIDSNGVNIFSKYPFTTVPLDTSTVSDDISCVMACYRVEIEGHTLYIFNVHLQSIGLNNEDKELYRDLTDAKINKDEIKSARTQLVSKLSNAFRHRARQADLLRSLIDSVCPADANVIVCGDFNDIPGSYATRTVQGNDMTDAWSNKGIGSGDTYHANRFDFRIDHIFYKGKFHVYDISVPHRGDSDHYPVYAKFCWN